MPNRVIREALLESPRFCSVSIHARELFIHLLLLADDFGLISLAPIFVRRRCFIKPSSQTKIEALFAELADADLIRIYTDGDKKFAFLPRFGQRLRILHARHPMPPPSLYADDEDAKEMFQENKDKFKKMSAICLSDDSSLRREVEVEKNRSRKEVEVEVEVEVETKRSEVEVEVKRREEKSEEKAIVVDQTDTQALTASPAQPSIAPTAGSFFKNELKSTNQNPSATNKDLDSRTLELDRRGADVFCDRRDGEGNEIYALRIKVAERQVKQQATS